MDLIRSSQTASGTGSEEMEAEGTLQGGSVEPSHPLPPWLHHRDGDLEICDSGYQGREERGEGAREMTPHDKDLGVPREKEIADVKFKIEAGRGELTGGEEQLQDECTVLEYESSFVAEVQKFVQRNSDMFDVITEKDLVMEVTPTLHNLKSEESCEHVM